MRAELIIDLHGLGTEVGKALGRDALTLPSLSTVAELWKNLGLEVTAMHVVAAGAMSPSNDATFDDLHTTAWWKTEQSFFDDQTFEVSLSMSPRGPEGPVGLDELITTIALHRSDALAEHHEPAVVVVMSTSPNVGPAVTHARGVPVRIASTVIHDSGLAHTRLELSWMGLLKDRFAMIKLPEVELRSGRPWKNDIAISTPYAGTEGRDLDVAIRHRLRNRSPSSIPTSSQSPMDRRRVRHATPDSPQWYTPLAWDRCSTSRMHRCIRRMMPRWLQ